MAAIISAQCAARVAPTVSGARKSAFSGKAVQARSVSLSAPRAAKLTVRAADAPPRRRRRRRRSPGPPQLNPNTPSPIFGGSTGGLLRKAQVRRASITGKISLGGQRILRAPRSPGLPPDRARSAAELGSTRALTPSLLEGVVCALRGRGAIVAPRAVARAGGGASPDRCKLERGYAPNGTLTETSPPSFSSTG